MRDLFMLGVILLVVAGGYALISPWFAADSSAVATSAGPEPVPAQDSDGPSPIATQFAKHLLVLDNDGNVHGYDDSKLAGVKYFAFYYSASWCPPCRAFTPELVSFYNSFKPQHPNFELIFVNDDRSDGDMISYMKGDSMPWPAVWFADIDNPDLRAKRYCGPGIPCLVLVDSTGKVLADSFHGGDYVGPEVVMQAIPSMVR